MTLLRPKEKTDTKNFCGKMVEHEKAVAGGGALCDTVSSCQQSWTHQGILPQAKIQMQNTNTNTQIHKHTKYTNKICVIQFPAVRIAGHIRGICPRQALFLLCLLSPTCHHLIVRRVKTLQTGIFKTGGYAVFFFIDNVLAQAS